MKNELSIRNENWPQNLLGNGMFDEFNRLQRNIDRMFQDTLQGWRPVQFNQLENSVFQPPCEWEETDGHYLLSVDLPGVQKRYLR